MEPLQFDLLVIGGGAGTKIAGVASKAGMRVALCEKWKLGGTCLNRGCIPSKMLIHASEVAEGIRGSAKYEIRSEYQGVNFEELVDWVCTTVDGTSDSIAKMYSARETITVFTEEARFVGERIVQSGDFLLTAPKVFVAAGCRPAIPPIDGLDSVPYWTSDDALRNKRLPKKLAVIGGGYIGCELAGFFGGLGSEIIQWARSGLLRFEDEEVAAEFSKIWSAKYTVHSGAVPSRVTYDEDTKIFSLTWVPPGEELEQVVEVDAVLVVTGVTPNTDTLHVEASGIATKDGNYIQVDECLRTTCPGVWAFGDIAGNFLFRHSANFEAEYLYAHVVLAEGIPAEYEPIDYTGMPHAVFANPQVAGVGAMEQELKAAGLEEGKDYVKGVNPYSASAMGDALRSDSGFVKLLIERGSRKILGCHIVGHEASILVHEIIPLIRLQGKLDDILYSIHIHPSLSELVRNSARKARDALVEAGEDIPTLLRFK